MTALYWLTSLAALVGVVLNIHRHVACFYVWAVTNAVWVYADATHGLLPQATLQAAYFGLSHVSRTVSELMQMSPDFLPVALERLGDLALGAEDWNWKSARAIRTVLRDIEDGRALKISSVPQGFLNGRPRDPNRIDQWYKSFLTQPK